MKTILKITVDFNEEDIQGYVENFAYSNCLREDCKTKEELKCNIKDILYDWLFEDFRFPENTIIKDEYQIIDEEIINKITNKVWTIWENW